MKISADSAPASLQPISMTLKGLKGPWVSLTQFAKLVMASHSFCKFKGMLGSGELGAN